MRLAAWMLLVFPLWIWGQEPDSSSAANFSADQTTADEQAAAAPVTSFLPADRDVSWLKLPNNIAEDQRTIWLAPLKLKERKYWIPAAAILAATAALVELDPKEGHYFRNASVYNGFNNIFSGQNTAHAMWLFPFALYGAGMVSKDSKMKSTALLAGEAVIDSEILTTVVKDIDRRKRPMDLPANGNFSETWFQGSAHGFQGNGSFPSGHTIAAFSIATVIAKRYGDHKWAPYAAYGTAALIGFSRLTLSSHFASDVFVGGVLGYSISRFGVLRQ